MHGWATKTTSSEVIRGHQSVIKGSLEGHQRLIRGPSGAVRAAHLRDEDITDCKRRAPSEHAL